MTRKKYSDDIEENKLSYLYENEEEQQYQEELENEEIKDIEEDNFEYIWNELSDLIEDYKRTNVFLMNITVSHLLESNYKEFKYPSFFRTKEDISKFQNIEDTVNDLIYDATEITEEINGVNAFNSIMNNIFTFGLPYK